MVVSLAARVLSSLSSRISTSPLAMAPGSRRLGGLRFRGWREAIFQARPEESHELAEQKSRVDCVKRRSEMHCGEGWADGARKCVAPKMQRHVKGVLCITQSQIPNVVRRSGRGPVEHGEKLGMSSRYTRAQCQRSLVYARRLGVDICKHISDDRVIRE